MKQAQAKRIYFVPTSTNGRLFAERSVTFDYFGGFAITQKHKTVRSIHESIKKQDSTLNVLEVSSKSLQAIGIQLSAFNLKYDNGDGNYYPVENIYQSSKVFVNGGAYTDLLYCSPADAKRDERLKNSGALTDFEFNNEIWELEPKSMFYDYIYLTALCHNKQLHKEILRYDAFTDIEFNPKRSINCQARSVAIFISLYKQGILEKTLATSKSFRAAYLQTDISNTMIAQKTPRQTQLF